MALRAIYFMSIILGDPVNSTFLEAFTKEKTRYFLISFNPMPNESSSYLIDIVSDTLVVAVCLGFFARMVW